MDAAEKAASTQPVRAKYGSRANNINLVRFIAASVVIYYHMAILLGHSDYTVMGQGLGAIAVNVFFVLSGYLIAGSWTHSSGFVSYLIRRAARIFPALIVVVMATVFVIGPIFTDLSIRDYFSDPRTWKYLSVILMSSVENVLPGVFDGLPYPSAVNGSLWTLRYEFLMYLVVPFAYFLLNRLGGVVRKPVTYALLVVLIAGYCLNSAGVLRLPDAGAAGLRLGAYFFTGCVVYEYSLARHFDVQYSVLALFFVLVFAQEEGPLCPLLMLVATTVFVFGFALVPQPRFARCFSKNDFSYGVYIWAFPIQQAIVQVGGGAFQDLVLLYSVAAFVVTLIFAVASWFLVEKPCMMWGKKLSKRF